MNNVAEGAIYLFILKNNKIRINKELLENEMM